MRHLDHRRDSACRRRAATIDEPLELLGIRLGDRRVILDEMGVGIDGAWQDNEPGGVDRFVSSNLDLRLHDPGDALAFDNDCGVDDRAGDHDLSAADECPFHCLLRSCYRCRNTGDSASWSPSPRRLKAITVRKIAKPGKVASHH